MKDATLCVRDSRLREREARYEQEGGCKGRYKHLRSIGATHAYIAQEFGIGIRTLNSYWIPKWNREDRGE